eukprot:64343_1
MSTLSWCFCVLLCFMNDVKAYDYDNHYTHWLYPQKYITEWYHDMQYIINFYAENCLHLNQFYVNNYNISIINKCNQTNYSFNVGVNQCLNTQSDCYNTNYTCNSMLTQIFYDTQNASKILNKVATLYYGNITSNSILSSTLDIFDSQSIQTILIQQRDECSQISDASLHKYGRAVGSSLWTDSCIFIMLTMDSVSSYTPFQQREYEIISDSKHPYSPYAFGALSINLIYSNDQYVIYACLPAAQYSIIYPKDSSNASKKENWLTIQYGYDTCKESMSVTETLKPGHMLDIHIDDKSTLTSQLTSLSNILNYVSIVDISDTYIIFFATISAVLLILFLMVGLCCYYTHIKKKRYDTQQWKKIPIYSLSLFFISLITFTVVQYLPYLSYIKCIESSNNIPFPGQSENNDNPDQYVNSDVSTIDLSIILLLIGIYVPFFGILISFNCMIASAGIKFCICKKYCDSNKCVKRFKKFASYWFCAVVLLIILAVFHVGNDTIFSILGSASNLLTLYIFCVPFFTKQASTMIIFCVFTTITLLIFSKYKIIVNAVFNVYLIPLLLITTFYFIPSIKRFTKNVCTLYLIILDNLTDYLVIYYWIYTKDYFWAFVQSVIVFTGHIGGLLLRPSNLNKTIFKMNVFDYIISFFGFAIPLFQIKEWFHPIYKRETDRLNVWQIIYQAFPTVTLQLYVTLTNPTNSVTLYQSIFVSFLRTSWNGFSYLLSKATAGHETNDIHSELTRKNTVDMINSVHSVPLLTKNEIKHDVESNSCSLMDKVKNKYSKYDYIRSNKIAFIGVYLFMLSDFFIRTCPIILLAAICHHLAGNVIGFSVFCILLLVFAPFEFFMCKWMRKDGFQSNWFIIKIFPICIISSLYNLLSCLDILDNISYFSTSVIFKKYMYEHVMRIIFSVFISLIVLILAAVKSNVLALILLGIYGGLIFVNWVSIKWISQYIDPTFEFGQLKNYHNECCAYLFIRQKSPQIIREIDLNSTL